MIKIVNDIKTKLQEPEIDPHQQ
jgi:hypothetical protein